MTHNLCCWNSFKIHTKIMCGYMSNKSIPTYVVPIWYFLFVTIGDFPCSGRIFLFHSNLLWQSTNIYMISSFLFFSYKSHIQDPERNLNLTCFNIKQDKKNNQSIEASHKPQGQDQERNPNHIRQLTCFNKCCGFWLYWHIFQNKHIQAIATFVEAC